MIVPINSDAYNLTADLATTADSTNVIVVVANQTVRDALTLKSGLTVYRQDLDWWERYNGSVWRTVAGATLQSLSTADATWSYNCQLLTHYAVTGEKYCSFQLIVARTGGGAFNVNTSAWTQLFTNLVPTGYRPTDNITVSGTYEFNGLGSALFKVGADGSVSASGVTGSFSCGTPTKLSASFVWKCA
jgi:hypothetical protein